MPIHSGSVRVGRISEISFLVSRFFIAFLSLLLLLQGSAIAEVKLPEIKPPQFASAKKTLKFKSRIHDVAVGGGGRYLLLQFKSPRVLGVFDVNQLKIISQMKLLQDDEPLIAAGASKAVIAYPKKGIVQRWDLKTGRRELTRRVDLPSQEFPNRGAKQTIGVLGMGSASEGPVLVAGGRGRGSQYRLLNLKTLKVINYLKSTEKKRGWWDFSLGSSSRVQVSADGHVFSSATEHVSPQTISTLVLKEGNRTQKHQYRVGDSNLAPLPVSDVFFLSGKVPNSSREKLQKKDGYTHYLRHAVSGPFWVDIPCKRLYQNPRDEKKTPTLMLHMQGDLNPLGTLLELETPFGDESFHAKSNYGQSKFSSENSFFFIPAAKVFIAVSSKRTRMTVFKVDIQEAVKKAGRDAPLIISNPPTTAKPGETYQYQVKLFFENEKRIFQVDSGPEGMKVSPTGLVTWSVPATSTDPAKNVVLAITSQNGKEVFQSFSIEILSDSPKPKKAKPNKTNPDKTVFAEPKPVEGVKAVSPPTPLLEVKLPAIVPPQLAAKHVEYKLPAEVSTVKAGAGGRFLVLHFPSRRQLGVFDVNQAKVIKYISADDGMIKFAVGADKLFVVHGDKHLISRYSLKTWQRETTVRFELPSSVAYADMGSASEGPLILGATFYRFEPGRILFFDTQTLQPRKIERSLSIKNKDLMRGNERIRASADGRVFGSWEPDLFPAEKNAAVLKGNILEAYPETVSERSVSRAEYLVPGFGSRYYLSHDLLANSGHNRKPNSNELSFDVYIKGFPRPIYTLKGIQPIFVRRVNTPDPRRELLGRAHYIPQAKLFITVDVKNDRLHLYQFDINKVLEKSEVSFLAISSLPPTKITTGKEYRYQFAVDSSKGGVTYRLWQGPEGMKLSADGLLTWHVLPEEPQGTKNVIAMVTDKSGQEAFQTIELKVSRPSAEKTQAKSEPVKIEVRTWTDKSGRYQVTGKYLSYKGEKVLIETASGEQFSVDFDLLSDKDRLYLVQMVSSQRKK